MHLLFARAMTQAEVGGSAGGHARGEPGVSCHGTSSLCVVPESVGLTPEMSGQRGDVTVAVGDVRQPACWLCVSFRQILRMLDEDIQPGRIEYETGGVEVTVKLTACFMRPFKNEVMDATVSVVNSVSEQPRSPFRSPCGCE